MFYAGYAEVDKLISASTYDIMFSGKEILSLGSTQIKEYCLYSDLLERTESQLS